MYKERLQSVLKNLHYDEAVVIGRILGEVIKLAELGRLSMQDDELSIRSFCALREKLRSELKNDM